ncbi:MAG: four-carbon acid sugar kinase family protein [Paracoccaceae bacterium]
MSALVSFYGDDFTGASENLAQFHRHGLRARLYFEPADHARVRAEAAELDVVGIAGVARSRAPAEMRDLLADAFSLFVLLGAPLNQYKICSTFDSAPEVGNFAVALEVARRFWPDAIAPVLASTPDFGRYTAFSNLFSIYRQAILRLDRNPALTNHPSTPMTEADLRRHLHALGAPAPGAIMLPELAQGVDALADLLENRGADGASVVLDAVDNDQLRAVCAAIWRLQKRRNVFCLAAQGLPQGGGGLIAAELGREPPAASRGAAPSGPGLVLSGSCADQTAVQLAAAAEAGWEMVHLPPAQLRSEDDVARAVAAAAPRVIEALSTGRSVAVFTARGAATEDFDPARAGAVGGALAGLFRAAVKKAGVRRAIFAGGDSSSYAMRTSGAYALEIAAFAGLHSSHACRLIADDELDGVEVVLKGGQAGGDDFFLQPLGGA